MEADLSTAARLLREHTADSHRRVEAQLDLLEAPTPARVLAAVDLLCGFWAGTEPALDSWFAQNAEMAQRLEWTRRARLSRFVGDRAVLAELCSVPVAAAPVAPAVFADIDEATVLGWLYVAEGATLGGAVIDRLLSDAGLPCRLQSFRPYAEGPQPMWRAYLEQLEAWTAGDPGRTDLVVDAGVRSFAGLERWVAVGRDEVAA